MKHSLACIFRVKLFGLEFLASASPGLSFLYVPPFVLSPPISVPFGIFPGSNRIRKLQKEKKKKKKLCLSDSGSYSQS